MRNLYSAISEILILETSLVILRSRTRQLNETNNTILVGA